MKCRRVLLALMAISLVLSACATGEPATDEEQDQVEGEPDQAGTEQGDRTLTFTRPGTADVVAEIFGPMLEEFESENPGVEIEVIDMGWEEYRPRLSTMLATGSAPDVHMGSQGQLYSFIADDGFLPLTDYIDDDLRAQIPEAVWDAATLDDEVWYIPASPGGYVLWYNAEIFEQAGLDPDSPPSTLDELVEFAQLIKSETGIAGLGLHGQQFVDVFNTFESVYSSMSGLPIWDDETSSWNFDDAEGLEALTYVHDLVHVHDISQPNVIEYNRGELRSLFRDGDVAMVLDGPWIISVLAEADPDIAAGDSKYQAADFPAGDAGSQSFFGVDGWAIASSAEDPDLAWDLIRHLVTPEKQHAHTVGYGGVPIQQDELAMEPFDQPLWQVLAASMESGYSRMKSEHFGTLEGILVDNISAMYAGAQTPEETIDRIVQETEQAISE